MPARISHAMTDAHVERVELAGHIIDSLLLPKVLDAASRFESRPDEEQMAELAERRKLVPLFS